MKKLLVCFLLSLSLSACTYKNAEEVEAEKAIQEQEKAAQKEKEDEQDRINEQAEKEEKEKEERLGIPLNMTLLEKELDKTYSNYSTSNSKDDWTIEEFEGSIVVYTKIEMKTSDKKVPVTYIHSPVIDDKYTNHYLRVGDETIYDDGTQE